MLPVGRVSGAQALRCLWLQQEPLGGCENADGKPALLFISLFC